MKENVYHTRHSIIRSIILFVGFIILSILVSSLQASQLTNIDEHSEWYYCTDKVKMPRQWYQRGFDAQQWEQDVPETQCGLSSIQNLVHSIPYSADAIQVRKAFSISTPASVKTMILSMACEGAFSAYLNGIEVIRNPSGTNSLKDESGSISLEYIDLSGFIHELLPGENVIAVQCSVNTAGRGEFLFIPRFQIQKD